MFWDDATRRSEKARFSFFERSELFKKAKEFTVFCGWIFCDRHPRVL